MLLTLTLRWKSSLPKIGIPHNKNPLLLSKLFTREHSNFKSIMSIILAASILVILVLYYVRVIFRDSKRQHLPLPPGPPGKPIIGNLWDLSSTDQQEWHHFFKHKELYGRRFVLDVMSLSYH